MCVYVLIRECFRCARTSFQMKSFFISHTYRGGTKDNKTTCANVVASSELSPSVTLVTRIRLKLAPLFKVSPSIHSVDTCDTRSTLVNACKCCVVSALPIKHLHGTTLQKEQLNKVRGFILKIL